MGKIRQSMAVLILMVAVKYLHKKNLKLFVASVLIAVSFQASALFFLVFLFFQRLNLSQRKMYIIIVISVIIGQSGIPEFIYYDLIGNNSFLGSIDFLGLKRLVNYADLHYTVREGRGYFGFIYMLINVIMIVYFYNHEKITSNSKATILFKTNYWGSIFFNLLFNLALLNSRLTMGFMMVRMFVVPYIFKCIKNRYLRLIFLSIYMLVVLARGYINFLEYYDQFVPFEFFWSV